VTCVGFSHDSVYVATADLSGLIKVWKVETKEEIFSFESSDAEVSLLNMFVGYYKVNNWMQDKCQ